MKKITIFIFLYMTSSIVLSDNNTWLTAKLYGHDNQYAALRKVTITQVDGKYKLFIKNQFKFTCDLKLDEKGQPAEASNCIGKLEPVCEMDKPNSICAQQTGCFQSLPETKEKCFSRWYVKEKTIKFRCKQSKKEDICKGKYTLSSGNEYDSAAELVIAKRRK